MKIVICDICLANRKLSIATTRSTIDGRDGIGWDMCSDHPSSGYEKQMIETLLKQAQVNSEILGLCLRKEIGYGKSN